MVDIGALPAERFDRATFPVRYYYTNLSQAAKFDSPAESASPFRKDVQEYGMMMDRMLLEASNHKLYSKYRYLSCIYHLCA